MSVGDIYDPHGRYISREGGEDIDVSSEERQYINSVQIEYAQYGPELPSKQP
jgi:hypothetical protein